ncbi:MAG TPA: methyltransferase domain-containing protein, partial [Anaerolineales bacterium]|nr:methyltransferase domain-containing protein [Anaerolineales bacterium]
MLETEATCPLCGDRRSSLFEARRFMDVEVRYRLCGRCGFVFQSPRMSGEALEGFYAHEYRLVYQDKAGPTEKDLLVQQKRAEHTIAFLSDRIDRVDRFLDIGSSAGILLEKMKGRFECLACGVEPGEAYRRFASDKGLEIYATLDELASAQTGPFDLVSMMHVLEHLADPVGYL